MGTERKSNKKPKQRPLQRKAKLSKSPLRKARSSQRSDNSKTLGNYGPPPFDINEVRSRLSVWGNRWGQRGTAPKLNLAIASRIYKAVEVGMIYERAAEAAGIHPETFRLWRRKGEADLAAGKQSVYGDFLVGLKNAERAGEQLCLDIVTKVAKGGWKIREEKNVEKTSDFEGDSSETSVTERIAAPNWQAAMTLLERRYPKLYGRKVLEIGDPEDVAAKLRRAALSMDKSIPTKPNPEDYFVDEDEGPDTEDE